jgi:hypothetical protein
MIEITREKRYLVVLEAMFMGLPVENKGQSRHVFTIGWDEQSNVPMFCCEAVKYSGDEREELLLDVQWSFKDVMSFIDALPQSTILELAADIGFNKATGWKGQPWPEDTEVGWKEA